MRCGPDPAQEPKPAPAPAPAPVEGAAAVAPLPFQIGETLKYDIYWGIIHVGTVKLTTEWGKLGDRKVIVIRMRTKSNSVLSTLYPVDDHHESILDPATFTPIQFTKNLKEGRKRYHEVTTFDRTTLKATWKSLLKKNTKQYAIKRDTKDILSFMYALRAKQYVVGKEIKDQVMADEKVYDLTLKPIKKERMKVSGQGKIEVIRIEPVAAFNGLFVRKGKMTIWTSTDKRAVWTRVEADTPFANVKVVLDKVEGPGDDRWVKKK